MEMWGGGEYFCLKCIDVFVRSKGVFYLEFVIVCNDFIFL